MSQMDLKNKPKRKYNKRDVSTSSLRKSRCGHMSKEGRYFHCENCLPVLPDENWDSDLDYFGIQDDLMEESENA